MSLKGEGRHGRVEEHANQSPPSISPPFVQNCGFLTDSVTWSVEQGPIWGVDLSLVSGLF